MITGGVERGTVDIASAIVQSGNRAIVASNGGAMVDLLNDAGAEHFSLSLNTKNPANLLLNAMRLVKLARQQSVDIIHARSRAPAWSALWAARYLGLRFITTYHGMYGQGSQLKRFYNSVMTRGDVVIAPSQFARDYIIKHHGEAISDKILVIPRGVNTNVFDAKLWPIGSGGDGDVVDRLLQRAERPIWLLPARLSRWKGHDVALRAFAQSGVAGQLIFCGADTPDADYRQELSGLIKILGLSNRVLFGNVQADLMPAICAAVDYVLSPSVKPESFGRAIIEGGASSKIVIATNHGGAAESIVHGETGFLVPPNDVSALATAMQSVTQLSIYARKKMENTARQRIVDYYSLKFMQSATLRVYHGSD